jgi:aminoglycoside 6'-N-acetyltransferase
VTLRPVEATDADVLESILHEPAVARWWGDFDSAKVDLDLLSWDEAETFAIELDGSVIGCLQWHEEATPEYRHAGLDIFLASEMQGRGLGREALLLAAGYLFTDRGHHRLVIDPRADNLRAIRAYERVGFRPVGVMRSYELGQDGAWHDGLLMDLLRDEFDDGHGPDGG